MKNGQLFIGFQLLKKKYLSFSIPEIGYFPNENLKNRSLCAVAVTASFVVFRGFLSIEADKGDNYHCRPWPLKTHWRLLQPLSVLVVTAVG
jgi:hypothetical protein